MGIQYRSLLTADQLKVKETEAAFRVTIPLERLLYKPEIEGVTLHASQLQFSKPLFTRHMAMLVTLHAAGARLTTQLPFESQCELVVAGKPDLTTINTSHALIELEADDVAIYDRWVINDAPTRSGLIFTFNALKKFAKDFNEGRTVLMYHNQQMPVGRTYKASVVTDTIRQVKGKWVKLRLYIPRRDEDGERIVETRFPITMLNMGVLAFDSIGFGGGRMRGIRIGEGDASRFFLEIDHDPNQQFELEAGETSFVFMGQARGAGNNKQVGDFSPDSTSADQGEMPNQEGNQGDPGAGAGQNGVIISRTLTLT